MPELNREDIIKALECFHQRILDTHLADDIREGEMMAILDALALINSQEQRIGELEAENEKLWKASRHLAQIVVGAAVIDQSAKEMLEGENE
jgi:hypothetical protein